MYTKLKRIITLLGTFYDYDESKSGSNGELNSDKVGTFVLKGISYPLSTPGLIPKNI